MIGDGLPSSDLTLGRVASGEHDCHKARNGLHWPNLFFGQVLYYTFQSSIYPMEVLNLFFAKGF
jgi:hypothetical protein